MCRLAPLRPSRPRRPPSQGLLSHLAPFHPTDSLMAFSCMFKLGNHIADTGNATLVLGEQSVAANKVKRT